MRPAYGRLHSHGKLGKDRSVRLCEMLCLLACLSLSRAAFAVTITDPGQAPVVLPAGIPGGSGLSAVSYVSGSQWLLLSDETSPNARLFRATIEVDLDTAEITGTPSLDSDLILGAGSDTEGLGLRDDGGFMVSDEVGPSIYRFDAGGTLQGALTIPSVFTAGLRDNLGFESLALGPDGHVWTANEEALDSDGPVSSFTDGTIVRLQRFDASFAPAGQWGYVTERIPGDITGSGTGRDIELSGVVDMVVLPDGAVLVMERAFGGDPQSLGFPIFEIRIYEIDFGGATDTSELAALSAGSFTPVAKTLLWEDTFTLGTGLADFEGIALGPVATNGDILAVLVADDNGGTSQQVLKSLRIAVPASTVPDQGATESGPHLRMSRNPVMGHAEFWMTSSRPIGRLEIFDVAGRRLSEVPTVEHGPLQWSTEGAAAGLYFARATSDSRSTIMKFTVLR